MARNGKCWYYEVHVKQPCTLSHLRVGWADFQLFSPHPSSTGDSTVSGGLGDDMCSVGFDGSQLWMAGQSYGSSSSGTAYHHHKLQRQEEHDLSSPPHDAVHVLGCFLDMEEGLIWFSLNGKEFRTARVKMHQDVSLSNNVVVPAISYSGGELE